MRCCQMWERQRPNEWLIQLLHNGDGTGRCSVQALYRQPQRTWQIIRSIHEQITEQCLILFISALIVSKNGTAYWNVHIALIICDCWEGSYFPFGDCQVKNVLRHSHRKALCFQILVCVGSNKPSALTFWGCWGPWCLHTCGRGSSCREGCHL